LGMWVALLAVALAPGAASAGTSWDDIRASLYGVAPIADGQSIMKLTAPGRPDDMRVVPVSVSAALTDGRTIKSLSILIDENPTPVAASFTLGPERDHVNLSAHFRVDRQSYVRAVAETSDGQLYMVSQLIKFAGGQSSCSAPPTGDPAEIAANMGKMKLTPVASTAAASSVLARARLDLSHPNHTGMVMDQITLLYTPLNMVSNIEVKLGEELVFKAEGSIALSQDPMIEFDFKRNGSSELTVEFSDTDGNAWQKSFPAGPGS
jgi:sulfur-oxidizing protein SoxY